MSLKRRQNAWREIIFDTRGEADDSVAQQRLALLEVWRKDYWAYLTARDVPTEADPAGRQIFWTVDEKTDATPIRPFPSNKLYLKDVGDEVWKYRMVFIDKARQMFMSSFLCLMLDWYAAFTEEREVVVSKVKEAGAIKLINDKIRTPHSRKPTWLKDVQMVDERPANIITYGCTGSTITGVAQNFALSDARGITASIVVIDETAYQEFFPEIYRAIVPMAARLWAVTTANVGNPGAAMFKMLAHEGKPGMGEAPEEAEEA